MTTIFVAVIRCTNLILFLLVEKRLFDELIQRATVRRRVQRVRKMGDR